MSYTLEKLFTKRSSPYDPGPDKILSPIERTGIAQDILELEVRRDDVWLLGYPRVGQTWCQEIIWLILNDLNFNLAWSTLQHIRAPKIEISVYSNEIFRESMKGSTIQFVKSMRSPRTIRSHLPFNCLPKQLKTIRPKIIYMTRNPKDVWCSFHPFMRVFFNYDRSFEESSLLFSEGKIPPGCLIDHALPFWHRRNEPNILFLTYEDMRTNTKATIKLIAEFLERPLKRKQIDQIYDYVSLGNMKNNPSVNMEWYLKKLKNSKEYSFIGDGEVGRWKNEMTSETSHSFDEWIDRKTYGTGLRFKYN